LREIDRQQVRFTRRQLREQLGWGDTQLKVHLARLVDFELVIAHRADSGGGLVYELAWSGEGIDGRRFLIGLTSLDQLAGTATTAARSGPADARSGSGRPPVGPQSEPGHNGSKGASVEVNGHQPAPDNTRRHEHAVPDTNQHDHDHDVVVVGVGS
jgi:hypothetical protein